MLFIKGCLFEQGDKYDCDSHYPVHRRLQLLQSTVITIHAWHCWWVSLLMYILELQQSKLRHVYLYVAMNILLNLLFITVNTFVMLCVVYFLIQLLYAFLPLILLVSISLNVYKSWLATFCIRLNLQCAINLSVAMIYMQVLIVVYILWSWIESE